MSEPTILPNLTITLRDLNLFAEVGPENYASFDVHGSFASEPPDPVFQTWLAQSGLTGTFDFFDEVTSGHSRIVPEMELLNLCDIPLRPGYQYVLHINFTAAASSGQPPLPTGGSDAD